MDLAANVLPCERKSGWVGSARMGSPWILSAMSASRTVTRAHLVLGRIGLGLNAVVWLTLALSDAISENQPFSDLALTLGVVILWILLVAGPYVIYLRKTTTPVPAVLTGIALNAVMISVFLLATFSNDGQAGLVLIWAIVGGYVVVGAGVLLDNFIIGYRKGTREPSLDRRSE